ncbi:MAG: ATP-binding cassette domain-containing protein [Geodermatophilaceae bacterium]
MIARGLHRSFRSVGAVQGMDLDAYPGRVTALVGPNGAGKTTLLLILATLLRPDAGWVRVAGFDPVTAPTEVRARMGWAPDMLGFYDALTVAEYLDVMAAAQRDTGSSAAGDGARGAGDGTTDRAGAGSGAHAVPGSDAAA